MEFDRKSGIGCSELAVVMGLSRFKTPLKLWAEKTGKIPIEDLSNIEAVELGSALEDFVAKRFSRKTGLNVRRDSRTFRHPDFPFLYGHIDRRVDGEDAILECKTTSVWSAKDWEGDEIPQEYVIQLMGYLGLAGKTTGYIACLIGGQKFIWKAITFKQEVFDKMVVSAKDFWENYVLADVAPVAISGDRETLVALFPSSTDQIIEFTDETAERLNHLVEERLGGLEVISGAKEELEKIEAQIKQFLGEAGTGLTGAYSITWRSQARQDPDREAMKTDGIWEKYSKTTSFRVLRTTKRKG